jgi:Leucine Rich repeat
MTTSDLVPRWLEELAERLEEQRHPVRNLNLNIRKLTSPMLARLLTPIALNDRIEVLNLTSSFLFPHSSVDGGPAMMISSLADAIQDHPSLQKLYLSYNKIVFGASLARVIRMNTRLIELHLDYNLLDKTTVIAIAESLRNNNTLQVLQLSSNTKLDDDVGVAIAQALGRKFSKGRRTTRIICGNKSLKTLGLSRCNLGPKTATALLKSLDEGNNVTLRRLTLDQNPDMPTVTVHKIMNFVKANRCGRYLLILDDDHPRDDVRDDDDGNYDEVTNKNPNNANSPSSGKNIANNQRPVTTQPNQQENKNLLSPLSSSEKKRYSIKALMPHVMERLDHDMVFFFLRQKPSLVPCFHHNNNNNKA